MLKCSSGTKSQTLHGVTGVGYYKNVYYLLESFITRVGNCFGNVRDLMPVKLSLKVSKQLTTTLRVVIQTMISRELWPFLTLRVLISTAYQAVQR